MVSPKIITKSPEKTKQGNKTTEGFPSIDPQYSEAVGKTSGKVKGSLTLKNDIFANQNLLQSQTYRLDQNFLNHLHLMGLPFVQEPEQNQSYQFE